MSVSKHTYRDFCETQPITDVWFGVKNEHVTSITFRLKGLDSPHLKLSAQGDCCSFSWFHFLDSTKVIPKPSIMSKTIGKHIKDISIGEQIELRPSGVQEIDQNNIVRIEFMDDSYYDLVLRNSSNGYYDGWIDIAVIDSIHPPMQTRAASPNI